MVMSFDTNTSSLLTFPHDPETWVPLGSRFISWYFYAREKIKWATVQQTATKRKKITGLQLVASERTCPRLRPIRSPKLAKRQAVLLTSGGMRYFPVEGVGRVGVGVVVGRGVVVAFVAWVVGAAVVVGRSALQAVTVENQDHGMRRNGGTFRSRDETRGCIRTYCFHSCCRYW